MLKNVATTGRKMVCTVDPHIKEDDDFYVYREAKQLGFFVKDRDGKDFTGFCWPGSNLVNIYTACVAWLVRKGLWIQFDTWLLL